MPVEATERTARAPDAGGGDLAGPTSGAGTAADRLRRAPDPALVTVQVGKSWFPEQKGSGLDRVFYNLMDALPRVGVAVRGVVAGTEQVEPETGGAARAFARPDAPLVTRLLRARRTIAAAVDGADLVAVHFALYGAPAVDVIGRKPLVVHFHGPWAAESAVENGGGAVVWAKRALEQAVYRRADRFIVLSEAFRDVLVQQYGVEARRVRIVPGGVDTARFATGMTQREARERLGWPTDRPVLLTVRRLARRMGLENLVRAVAEIRRYVPDVLVLIGGRGPLAGDLAALVDSMGLERHVRFLGFVPDADLPTAYRAADFTVVPTEHLEGFGLVVAESLAAGTPPLVTPIGGLPEVVRDLDTGLVLPGAGTAAIAEGATRALRGRGELPDSSACQAFARARYDWSGVAEKTYEVYSEVA